MCACVCVRVCLRACVRACVCVCVYLCGVPSQCERQQVLTSLCLHIWSALATCCKTNVSTWYLKPLTHICHLAIYEDATHIHTRLCLWLLAATAGAETKHHWAWGLRKTVHSDAQRQNCSDWLTMRGRYLYNYIHIQGIVWIVVPVFVMAGMGACEEGPPQGVGTLHGRACCSLTEDLLKGQLVATPSGIRATASCQNTLRNFSRFFFLICIADPNQTIKYCPQFYPMQMMWRAGLLVAGNTKQSRLYWIVMNTCRAPHLVMSPNCKRFTTAVTRQKTVTATGHTNNSHYSVNKTQPHF